MKVTVTSFVNSALLTLAASVAMPVFAQNPVPSDVVDLNKVRLKIVDAVFVTKLNSEKAQFEESKPRQYHGLIVTVRVMKTAGEKLALTCQDINLHYRYSQESDVASCYGLSNFTTQQSEDRFMSLYSQGYGTSTTEQAATLSDTVYVDVFFQKMEPQTRDLYLFISQPTGAHFTTPGWR
jgi:hypothetical protein